ncbi:hypothetical protein B0A48_14701 [Cryoendolithus antarcticus]|uniref:Uncharacterized protein n=1 Tax=Cryoendolithus antarcticus TaxID=1507870 RepID=A0A1V8SKF0_9PEZI|nr:hypothetical protein B0A48_14701 [Cryoendolithus antarcticus]
MTSPMPNLDLKTTCGFDDPKSTVLVGDIADMDMVEVVNSKTAGVRTRAIRKSPFDILFDSSYKRKTWSEVGELKIKDWHIILVHTLIALEPYAVLYFAGCSTLLQVFITLMAVMQIGHHRYELGILEIVSAWMAILALGYAFLSVDIFWTWMKAYIGVKPAVMKPWCSYKVMGAMAVCLFLGWSTHSLFLWGHGVSWGPPTPV